MIKIYDFTKSIRGCAVFEYKGFSLSMSTIADPHELLIFSSAESSRDMTLEITGTDALAPTVEGIIEAASAISAYLTKIDKTTPEQIHPF